MRVICTPNAQQATAATQPQTSIGVVLYGLPVDGAGGIGNRLIRRIQRWENQPSQLAWDFLSIALAVTAADTFVRRDLSPDRWTREINLEVALYDPQPWVDIADRISVALRFLSGDYWTLIPVGGGKPVPRAKRRVTREDCVCLFSGGLDSLIGAIDILSQGHLPVLVSHTSRGEKDTQEYLTHRIGKSLFRHFSENTYPQWQGSNDVSMRTRSFIFISYGVLVASGLQPLGRRNEITLFLPENGLIALNPPLTPRRIGSLSTRTAHPHFISSIQEIIDRVGLAVKIENPYGFRTKGEMLSGCQNSELLRSVIDRTISCGKFRRINQQCGRCIPCIIRRAAYHAAGIPDRTPYKYSNLAQVRDDDILSFQTALVRRHYKNLKRWLLSSGPLPSNPSLRAAYVDVFRRGLDEVDAFLP